MLYIENRMHLKDAMILPKTTNGYYVEGVYEYEDHYQIHIRSNDTNVWDELLILQRNRVKNENSEHNFYTLYNSNEPQRRKNITKQQIQWKDMFLHNIELILQMNN